ncbi:hypothetical protein DYC15_03385 [Vibrio cholerae]|nr:hypothetical protein [Vibrio cholerae]GIA85788.1 hypothetical protein VCSRO41_0319 [Vibrio cholerae]
MSRLLLFLCLFPLSSNASVCLDAIPSHIYFLSSGVEYCLETKYQSIYMYGAEDSLGVVEVSNFDKTVFEILYPGEILEVPKVFRITSFQNSYLVEVNGVIYIYDAPIQRTKRSLKPLRDIGLAVVQNLSAAAGTSAAGGDDVQIAPVVIGSILGTAVGVASGPLAPIVGPAVSAAITQNINSNAGKPRPPLTSIDVTGNIPSKPPTILPRPFPNNKPPMITPSPFSSNSGSHGGSSSGSSGCGGCHR